MSTELGEIISFFFGLGYYAGMRSLVVDMTPEEFRQSLQELNMTQREFARLIRRSERTVGGWVSGAVPIPGHSSFVLRLLLLIRREAPELYQRALDDLAAR